LSQASNLFNRPEPKRLSGFKTGILMIDKIKPTIPIRAEVRLILSETKPIERAWVFFGLDLNGYEILIAQFVYKQDFGRKSGH
jgi:hypothetical protein